MEREQIRLAALVAVPEDGQGFQGKPEHLLFALDIQYVDQVAFVGLHAQRLDGTLVGRFVGTFKTEVDYVPGLFAFREGPPLLEMVKAMEQTELRPDLLLIDGHGLAHPRRFGVACMVGVESGLPTVGCAKDTLLHHRGTLAEPRGSTLPVLLEGKPVGAVLRTQHGVRPVYISPGHQISLQESLRLVLNLTGPYRICEPLRSADQLARRHAHGETLPGVRVFS